MKKLILTLALSVSFILSSFAQRNYAQELVDLLQQGKCFEAREFREQFRDKLPANDKALDVLYNANMALFFNKPDSNAIYLEDLLANYELKMGPVISIYYGKLLTVYDSQQRFKEGMMVCDKYLDHLRRNPFDRNRDFIRNEMNMIEKVKKAFKYRDLNEPRIRIEKDNSGNNRTVRINDSEYLRFNAKYNGFTAETWFDTGVPNYFMITRSLADKMGTKLVDKSQDSVRMINGILARAKIEVIDKINLGNLTLFNIPVLVFNNRFIPYTTDSLNAETKLNPEKKFGDRQIVMGLSTIKLIGRIDFDLEKRTVSFPGNTKKTGSNDLSNIFFVDKNLYLKLKINGLNYVGYLNTGSDCALNITSSFYEKNKRLTETDSIAQKKPSGRHVIRGNSFNNVRLDVKLINRENGEVLVSDRRTTFNIFDGIVGVSVFKKLGSKIMIDFINMNMKVSD